MPVKTPPAEESVPGLENLIQRVQDLAPLPSTHEMRRWIVATQHNVEEAEAMYRKSANWRRQKGVDRILKWKPPVVLRNFYPGGFAGFDREGCPVWIIPFGQADMKGMLACVSKEEFMDFTLKIVECSMLLMKKKSLLSGKPVSQHVFIFDLEGFSLMAATHGPTMDILQKLIAVYEANYPETLKAAYVLNASSFFQIVFKIVKSTVQQKTLSKIQVFGSDDWKQPLLAALPAEILPPQWGGTKILNDNEGICMGGEVTEVFQSQHQPEEIPGMGDICTMKIGPGSVITLRYTVSQDCQIRWKFKSEGGDLEFGVKRKEAEKTSDGTGFVEDLFKFTSLDVMTSTRVASHKDLQAGVMQCQAGFTYLLNFDNTFSRFKAKNVTYAVILESSDSVVEISEDKPTVDDLVKCVRDSLDNKEDKKKKKTQNSKTSKISKSFVTKKKSSG